MQPIPIHAYNPGPITGDGNWTWLIPGPAATLIDAGTGDPRHLDAVERALAGGPLTQVLVTHGHGDHASGAPALAERFPRAAFRKLAWPERDGAWPVAWEQLAPGAVIQAGDSSLTAIHTPGHAPDHVCFWHEPSRTLFGGDLAILGSTVWIPARLQGDLADYVASLERILALKPGRILPAHGPVIEHPDALLRAYLAHRRERDRQIVDALRRGASTPAEIVERVYADLSETQRPLAAESVTAHLTKLEREGRARLVVDRWHIIDG